MSVPDIEAWLAAIGLPEYAAAFRANDIDATVLPLLTADDLRELGVASIGHRRRILATAAGPGPPEPAAERRVLSVMFCDMRNFTRVSELMPPENVRSLVNSFFSTMTGAIREQRGTLDKYIGDAIMAFWGAPLADPAHAANAARAALVGDGWAALAAARPACAAAPALQ